MKKPLSKWVEKQLWRMLNSVGEPSCNARDCEMCKRMRKQVGVYAKRIAKVVVE